MTSLTEDLGLSLDGKRVLAIVAHYDDETLFCGGTLLRIGEQTEAIGIAVLTDVATTNAPKKPSHTAPLRAKESLRRERRLSAFGAVCQEMNTESFHLNLQNLSNGEGLESALRHNVFQDGRSQLAELIRRFMPDVIITHGKEGEYGHAQHRVTYDIVKDLWTGRTINFAIPDRSTKNLRTVSVDQNRKRSLLELYRYGTTQDREWVPAEKPEYSIWCGQYEYFTIR